MKKLLFSLLTVAGCTVQTFSQAVVEDPGLLAATVANWAESLEKTTTQIQTLQEQKNILAQGIEIYTKVSNMIKNATTVKDILNRHVNMLSFASEQFSLSSDYIEDVDTYKNYTQKILKIIDESKSVVDLLTTIISDKAKMTDGERLNFLINIDEKTKLFESRLKSASRKYVKLQNNIRYIRALKMK